MNEVLSLDRLAEKSGREHPNSDLAVALVADCNPDELQRAADKTIVNNVVETVEAERANEIAQGVYDAELETDGGGQTTEKLRLAAADSLAAEERLKTVQAKTELASRIGKVQKRLARPMKLAATLLTALAIGGGTAGALKATEPDWSSYKVGQTRVTKEDLKDSYRQTTIIFGIAMTFFGGIAGTYAGGRLGDREARRRARRIVAKEDQTT